MVDDALLEMVMSTSKCPIPRNLFVWPGVSSNALSGEINHKSFFRNIVHFFAPVASTSYLKGPIDDVVGQWPVLGYFWDERHLILIHAQNFVPKKIAGCWVIVSDARLSDWDKTLPVPSIDMMTRNLFLFVLLIKIFCVVSFVDPWCGTFWGKLNRDEYHQQSQIEKWKSWINQNRMTVACTADVVKGKPDRSYKKTDPVDKVMSEDWTLKRCQIKIHPQADKTLRDVFEVLWGFSNIGRFLCKNSKFSDVIIQFSKGKSHQFQVQYSQGQINLKMEGKMKSYSDVMADLDRHARNARKNTVSKSHHISCKTDITW